MSRLWRCECWSGMSRSRIECESCKCVLVRSHLSSLSFALWPVLSFSWRCRLITWLRWGQLRLTSIKKGGRKFLRHSSSKLTRAGLRWTWIEPLASLDSSGILFYSKRQLFRLSSKIWLLCERRSYRRRTLCSSLSTFWKTQKEKDLPAQTIEGGTGRCGENKLKTKPR